MPRSRDTAWKYWRKKDRRLSEDEIPYLRALTGVANSFEGVDSKSAEEQTPKSLEEEAA
jgi:hypothetical protein